MVVAIVDLAIVLGALAVVTLVPVEFLVPYNDEWLRMNFLADNSVWKWTTYHAETWVVRPTAEIILGWISLLNTRPALAHAFDTRTFLTRFHLGYYVLAVAFWALVYLNAAIVARRAFALPHATLMFFGLAVCWLMSDELGFGFYWADSYGNILMPFVLLTCAMPLVCREDWRENVAGYLLLLLAALGHEVISIFSCGFLLIALIGRRPTEHALRLRAIQAGVLLLMLGLVYLQLFALGAEVRNEHYNASAGKRYDFESAWLNIKTISPVRAALATFGTLAAIAVYRARVQSAVENAVADVRRNRWFWILLAVGVLVTAFLPLGSAGLKKGRLAVSYYSTFTYLWFVLLGAVLYPVFDRWLERPFQPLRRFVPSVVPVLLIAALGSSNFADFQDAVQNRLPLRNEARNYMESLFVGQAMPHNRLTLCRPPHPYSKPGKLMTDQNEQTYFRIDKIRNHCPKRFEAQALGSTTKNP